MNAPEKCPKCGMSFYRTIQDKGSYLNGNDESISYTADLDEFDCSSRGTRDGGFFNQSGICLMRERDALRDELAALKAEVLEAKTKLADAQEENLALNHRVEVEDADVIERLEAERATMVPREVAEDCAFLGLCCGSISTTNPYWAPEVVRSAACAENPKNDPGWADAILKDALARAEAEAAKPQADKEKSE